ncbi:hypothetical protein LRAMOSA09187 [Lichtheimia ramosa]|uniref:N-acetyltransferase domain-containing protein n=1 Tax=Lichtheimia ramosa TaxID=688394 RepID=A0A077WH07_9FUNG|nr:hypothetical protein LRAMOSA09187 [Lichtheimia ramosa]
MYSNRITRQLTVNLDQQHINVRPIIKGAIKEAAHTLTSAYNSTSSSNSVLVANSWLCHNSSKHDEFLYVLFKNIANAATLASRDYAIQVEGCSGVLIWSLQRKRPIRAWIPPCLGGTLRLARLIGWTSALKSAIQFQPSCTKMRRKLMAEDEDYITIHYVGVLPHERHKGYGRALLQHVLDKADAAHYAVYAEVSDAYNVAFFEKMGFIIRANVVTNNIPVFLMVREPVISPQSPSPIPLIISPGRRRNST